MNKNYTQGGDNKLPLKFYQLAINQLTKPQNIANFGCGEHFIFEKLLLDKIKNIRISSFDISVPKNVPNSVKFECKNLTKLFVSDEKFDAITFFELIEHIDETDNLLKNIKANLKPGGELVFSFPNLASIYGRLSLLFGFQPHILEISNEYANFGAGPLGRLSNPTGTTVHHIRGITLRAMKELLQYHGFKIAKIIPYEYRIGELPKLFSGISPILIIKCLL
jgi:2-polyprenyl-3-methyl-5-hydroxy-6-metoxy-1,4-benzoquinol methylase